MKDILVWHQGALGDLVLSLPAIYSIKKHFSRCRIHLVARSDLSEIIVSSGIADVVSSNEKAIYADFFREGPVPASAAEFLRGMSGAFLFMKREERTFVENLGRHIPLCKIISTVPRQGERLHIASFQLERLQSAGIYSQGMPRLHAAPPGVVKSDISSVTIHPGSGGKWKRWGLRGFLDVMDALAGEGNYRFNVLLGPAEEELREECDRFISTRRIPAGIVSERPASYIASVIAKSSLFVGNDSGITHLAALIGTPVVAVFGPTDPAIWGPMGQKVRIVRSEYPCVPCSDATSRLCPELRCLTDVTCKDVLKAAHELLSESRAGFIR
jgi:ADP-heptose:LPS heptosyltransferase